MKALVRFGDWLFAALLSPHRPKILEVGVGRQDVAPVWPIEAGDLEIKVASVNECGLSGPAVRTVRAESPGSMIGILVGVRQSMLKSALWYRVSINGEFVGNFQVRSDGEPQTIAIRSRRAESRMHPNCRHGAAGA